MKKSIGRLVTLLASLGALATPVPAASQEFEELRICLRNCYEAYYVITQQPAFYQMCRANCIEWYGNGLVDAEATVPLAVLRYN